LLGCLEDAWLIEILEDFGVAVDTISRYFSSVEFVEP
jgi:hypothetical protein